MGSMALIIVIIVGLVMLFNPYLISAHITHIASLKGKGLEPETIRHNVLAYSFALFAGMAIFGFLIMATASWLGPKASQFALITAGLICALAGTIEIKEFIAYGKGTSLHIHDRFADRLHRRINKNAHPSESLMLGFYTAITSLTTSIGIALISLALLFGIATRTPGAGPFIIFGLLIAAPALVIMHITQRSNNISSVIRAKERNKPVFRLWTGVCLTILGWLLILSSTNTIGLV